MSEIKKVQLRAFNISTGKLSKDKTKIMENLSEKLLGSNARSRSMQLSKQANSKEDVLCDFAVTKSYIFGTIVRIAQPKDAPSVTLDLLEKETFSFADISRSSNDNKTWICTESYDFVLNEKYLVTTLERTKTISRLQVYLNWFIESLRGDTLYQFQPIIDKSRISINKIKQITCKDSNIPLEINDKNEVASTLGTKIIQLGKDFLNRIVEGGELSVDSLKEVCTATLTLKFKKPKQMTEDEYLQKTSALLKPVSDADNISFITTDGRKITGADILYTKEIEVDVEDEVVVTQSLIQGMQKVLNEVKLMNYV